MIKQWWNKHKEQIEFGFWGLVLIIFLILAGIEMNRIMEWQIEENRLKDKEHCFKVIEKAMSQDKKVTKNCSKYLIEYYQAYNKSDGWL